MPKEAEGEGGATALAVAQHLGVEPCVHDEAFERFKRLDHELREIGKLWDRFRAAEKLPAWERYTRGDLEACILGETVGGVGANKCKWVGRVSAHVATHFAVDGHEGHVAAPAEHHGAADAADGHGGNDEVVLVDFVRFVDRPEIRVPSRVRFYRVLEESFYVRAGEGRLYLSNAGGLPGYEFLPLFMEREVDEIGGFPGGAHDSRGRVVKRGSKVVYRVPDHEGEMLRDGVLGKEGQLHDLTIWIGAKGCEAVHAGQTYGLDPLDLVEDGVEGLRHRFDILDVCVGPIDF